MVGKINSINAFKSTVNTLKKAGHRRFNKTCLNNINDKFVSNLGTKQKCKRFIHKLLANFVDTVKRMKGMP